MPDMKPFWRAVQARPTPAAHAGPREALARRAAAMRASAAPRKRSRAAANADSDSDYSVGGARPVSRRTNAARDDRMRAAGDGGAGAASPAAPTDGVAGELGGGPSDELAVPGASGRPGGSNEQVHFCVECCVPLLGCKWRRDLKKKQHQHVCAGGFGGKAAKGRGEPLPCSTCTLNEQWLLDAPDDQFGAFLDVRPTLRLLWDAVCSDTDTDEFRRTLTKDLRGNCPTSVGEAAAILHKRRKLQTQRGAAAAGDASNPNSDAEAVESDAAEDSAPAPSAAARAAPPSAEPAGEFNPAVPAPARHDAQVQWAPNAQAAGAAWPGGTRSNVSAHVVDEPVARFGMAGEVEARLHDGAAGAIQVGLGAASDGPCSVILISGESGIGKTKVGHWFAQRRARREHAWQPSDLPPRWMGHGQASEPRPPADALGPFFTSLRGLYTPAAASWHMLQLLQLCFVPTADTAAPEADPEELLHATLRAALPDVAGAPPSASSCLFVFDDCDELLATPTAAWAWALRIAGVAPGVRVIMLARNPSQPPSGAAAKAAQITLPPLSAVGVREWFSKVEPAMPDAVFGLELLSAEGAARLARACGGLPGVIEPLVHAFQDGTLCPDDIAALVQALASDVPGSAALTLEMHGVPPSVLQLSLPQQLCDAVQALAALAPPPLFPPFSRKDAFLALGCATQGIANKLLYRLKLHGVVCVLGVEEQGPEVRKPENDRRIFRMCGLRVALSRGSAPWFSAVARLQRTDDAAAAGPSVSGLLAPSPSLGDFSLGSRDFGAVQPQSPAGDAFGPLNDFLARADSELVPSAQLQAGALVDTRELPFLLPPPQERGIGRRRSSQADLSSIADFLDASGNFAMGPLREGTPSWEQAPAGGTAAKARGGGAARKTSAPGTRAKRAQKGGAARPQRGAQRATT